MNTFDKKFNKILYYQTKICHRLHSQHNIKITMISYVELTEHSIF